MWATSRMRPAIIQSISYTCMSIAILYDTYSTHTLLQEIKKDVKFQRETIESVTGLYKSLASRESTRRP
jgi:hypothetical protein